MRRSLAAQQRDHAVMMDLLAGGISLLVAGVFLAILVYAVPSVPLWIVILIGLATMVASLIETLRSDQRR
jgi:hypothetical protein